MGAEKWAFDFWDVHVEHTHTGPNLSLLPHFLLLAKCQHAAIFGHKLTPVFCSGIYPIWPLISGNRGYDKRLYAQKCIVQGRERRRKWEINDDTFCSPRSSQKQTLSAALFCRKERGTLIKILYILLLSAELHSSLTFFWWDSDWKFLLSGAKNVPRNSN